jgi:DNA-binding NarL/FixJ family response regulator
LSTRAIMQLAEPEFEPLGLVWVDCDLPLLAVGLDSVLNAKARLHRGKTPPTDHPSAVVCCLDADEDVGDKVARLGKAASGAPVLVFGFSADPILAQSALRAGARGFLHCGMEPSQIARAISFAIKGEIVIPREMLTQLVVAKTPADPSVLTLRQREALELVAQGMTNAQIANRMYLSESTVKQHLRGAFKTLGVRNRMEAVRALQDG